MDDGAVCASLRVVRSLKPIGVGLVESEHNRVHLLTDRLIIGIPGQFPRFVQKVLKVLIKGRVAIERSLDHLLNFRDRAMGTLGSSS